MSVFGWFGPAKDHGTFLEIVDSDSDTHSPAPTPPAARAAPVPAPTPPEARAAPVPAPTPPPAHAAPVPFAKDWQRAVRLPPVESMPWALALAPKTSTGDYKEASVSHFQQALKSINWHQFDYENSPLPKPHPRLPTKEEEDWLFNVLENNKSVFLHELLDELAQKLDKYVSAKVVEQRQRPASDPQAVAPPASDPRPIAPQAVAPRAIAPQALSDFDAFRRRHLASLATPGQAGSSEPAVALPAVAPHAVVPQAVAPQAGPSEPPKKPQKTHVNEPWSSFIEEYAKNHRGSQRISNDDLFKLFAEPYGERTTALGLPTRGKPPQQMVMQEALDWARDKINATKRKLKKEDEAREAAAKRKRGPEWDATYDSGWAPLLQGVRALHEVVVQANPDFPALDEDRLYDHANPAKVSLQTSVEYIRDFIADAGDKDPVHADQLHARAQALFGAKRGAETRPPRVWTVEEIYTRLLCELEALSPTGWTDLQREEAAEHYAADKDGVSSLFETAALSKGIQTEDFGELLSAWKEDDSILNVPTDLVDAFKKSWKTRKCTQPTGAAGPVARQKTHNVTYDDIKESENIIESLAEQVIDFKYDIEVAPTFKSLDELKSIPDKSDEIRDAITMLEHGVERESVYIYLPNPWFWIDRHPVAQKLQLDNDPEILKKDMTGDITGDPYKASFTGYDPDTKLFRATLCTASPITTTPSRKILAANPQVGGWTYIPSTFPPGQGRVRRGVERRRAAPRTAPPPPPAAPFFAPEVPPGMVSTWAEGLAREEGRGRRRPWLTGFCCAHRAGGVGPEGELFARDALQQKPDEKRRPFGRRSPTSARSCAPGREPWEVVPRGP